MSTISGLLKNAASPLVGDEHRRISPPARGGAMRVPSQVVHSGRRIVYRLLALESVAAHFPSRRGRAVASAAMLKHELWCGDMDVPIRVGLEPQECEGKKWQTQHRTSVDSTRNGSNKPPYALSPRAGLTAEKPICHACLGTRPSCPGRCPALPRDGRVDCGRCRAPWRSASDAHLSYGAH